MLRLCLLAALAVAVSGHIHPYPQGKSFGSINLSPYWNHKYCAPIRLRYPQITDLTCYYIVYYYVHSPPKYFLPYLHLQGLQYGSVVPQHYWIQYLSQLIDLLPNVFYKNTNFYGQLQGYLGDHYPSVISSSIYYDHLAICDTYFGSNLVTPYGWNKFKPFYNQHILSLRPSSPYKRWYSTFPQLPDIVSRLRSYSYVSSVSYFKKISITSLSIGSTKLVYPRQPYIQPKHLWFPRQTLRGLYAYLSKRRFNYRSFISQIQKMQAPKRITWGHGYTGLACQSQYAHLAFLCPAWQHGLLPVLRLRFSRFPKRIIYSKRINFQTFISGFLHQWRPTIKVYSQTLVTSCLVAFDNYACSWLGVHYRSQYGGCRPNNLWYPGFYKGGYNGCKAGYSGYKCHSG